MDDKQDTLTLEHKRDGDKMRVSARWCDELKHEDRVDPSSATARKRFANALCSKIPAADPERIEEELLKIADTSRVKEQPAPTLDDTSVALLAETPEEVRAEAEELLTDPVLIQQVLNDIEGLGVAGERELTAHIYLTGTSRLTDRPLANIVQGPSSSGKSFVIEEVSRLFPPETVIHATHMTPQALFHMPPGSLRHKFVVAGERSRAEDDNRAEATRALREMLSSGRLTKLMPVKVEGKIETVLIEQDGPIAYVESTTLTKIFDEDANRAILLHTDEQTEQTRRIVATLATAYSGAGSATMADRIIQRHHALQRLLKPQPVVIPYAERLGELFPVDRVQVRRAFAQVMGLLQAIVLLNQRQRATDSDGRLIATEEDYQLAQYLLAKPMARMIDGDVSAPARRFYDRLAAWASGPFTSREAVKNDSASKSAVYGYFSELHDVGCLEMIEPPRGRSPATWQLTAHRPDTGAASCLPTVEELFPDGSWKHGNEFQVIAVE